MLYFFQLIGAKVTSATPTSIGDQTRKEAEFVKYTPNPNAPGYNNNAKQRVVRMVAAQVRVGLLTRLELGLSFVWYYVYRRFWYHCQ